MKRQLTRDFVTAFTAGVEAAPSPTTSAQPQPTEPPRKTIELSEQTPLSGFDRKQKQVEAGEISDVGASIDRVGDRGRQSARGRVEA